jgi:hypothetical protein
VTKVAFKAGEAIGVAAHSAVLDGRRWLRIVFVKILVTWIIGFFGDIGAIVRGRQNNIKPIKADAMHNFIHVPSSKKRYKSYTRITGNRTQHTVSGYVLHKPQYNDIKCTSRLKSTKIKIFYIIVFFMIYYIKAV